MAKKSQKIEITAGRRIICPGCSLQYRNPERFAEHLRLGCKPEQAKGETWSELDPETVGAPADEAAQE